MHRISHTYLYCFIAIYHLLYTSLCNSPQSNLKYDLFIDIFVLGFLFLLSTPAQQFAVIIIINKPTKQPFSHSDLPLIHSLNHTINRALCTVNASK